MHKCMHMSLSQPFTFGPHPFPISVRGGGICINSGVEQVDKQKENKCKVGVEKWIVKRLKSLEADAARCFKITKFSFSAIISLII